MDLYVLGFLIAAGALVTGLGLGYVWGRSDTRWQTLDIARRLTDAAERLADAAEMLTARGIPPQRRPGDRYGG